MAKLTPIPIMGKGCRVKELEHCPPVYHFELTEDEMSEALKDPASMAARLGLDTPITIHVSARRGIAPNVTPQGVFYCCIQCQTDSWCCTPWGDAGAPPPDAPI